MTDKTTLAWLAGGLIALLVAFIVVSGIQGRSSDAEARLDAPASQTAPRSR